MLHKTFLTPIDRSDIHLVISRLDDILDLIDTAHLPETGGLRMDLSDPATNSAPPVLAVSLVEEPMSDDEVIDEEGINIYLSGQAAGLLEDKELDAQADGSQITFLVHEQP